MDTDAPNQNNFIGDTQIFGNHPAVSPTQNIKGRITRSQTSLLTSSIHGTRLHTQERAPATPLDAKIRGSWGTNLWVQHFSCKLDQPLWTLTQLTKTTPWKIPKSLRILMKLARSKISIDASQEAKRVSSPPHNMADARKNKSKHQQYH